MIANFRTSERGARSWRGRGRRRQGEDSSWTRSDGELGHFHAACQRELRVVGWPRVNARSLRRAKRVPRSDVQRRIAAASSATNAPTAAGPPADAIDERGADDDAIGDRGERVRHRPACGCRSRPRPAHRDAWRIVREPRGIDRRGGAHAGHAGERDVVDERRRERARGARCDRASRSARRAGSRRRRARASGVASSASSSIGRSTVSTASTPAAAARFGERLGPHHEDRVVVAEQHDRRRDAALAQLGDRVERARQARRRRRARAPSRAGSTGRRPTDRRTARRARSRRRRRDTPPRRSSIDVVGIGIAERQVRDERGAVLGGGAIERGAQPASRCAPPLRDRGHVLVAAARQPDDHDVRRRRRARPRRAPRSRARSRARTGCPRCARAARARRAPRRRCATT